jgi:RimJ/RimL family protein N-acetyltransferase
VPKPDPTAKLPHVLNALGQPVGVPLPDWRRPPRPPREVLDGRTCRLEPLDPERHARDLFDANALDVDGRGWTYLPYGPFADLDAYLAWMRATCLGDDPLFHAIVDRAGGRAVGVASYLRIDPVAGSIEVGHLRFAPLLQRKIASTEAMYLMMKRAFELGYRRYEWKCDALNAPSRAAATRLGFTFEGIFRQAIVIKHRNRDTAWFSILDSEWPRLDAAFRRWLDPANFAADGTQKLRLSQLTAS